MNISEFLEVQLFSFSFRFIFLSLEKYLKGVKPMIGAETSTG